MNVPSWATLHDTVIAVLSLELPLRLARIEVKNAEGTLRVCGENTSLLTCPQVHPWGLSRDVSINEARHTRILDGERLEIETQNGDVIVIEAKRIYLQSGAIASDATDGAGD